jgi:hypothetical protein
LGDGLNIRDWTLSKVMFRGSGASPFVAAAGFLAAAWVGAVAFADSAHASETRAYVLDWFAVAAPYYPHGDDCPRGVNASLGDIDRRELARLGYRQDDIEKYVHGLVSKSKHDEIILALTNRGRIDGRAVNVYANPESAPDPHIKTAQGRYGYGFNLDGQTKPGDLVDPDTGEMGIDNNLYRVDGCQRLFRRPKPPERDEVSTFNRATESYAAPAFLIEIDGIDNLEKDDDVIVHFYFSLDPALRDASGDAARDRTMRIDPNPLLQRSVHGKIKGGVLTTEPLDLTLPGFGELWWAEQFLQARWRVRFMPDGSLQGILGGYQPWLPLYQALAHVGLGWDANGLDVLGRYYALKRYADAYPDPKTGQNTAISAAYEITAVPSIIVRDTEDMAFRGASK